MNMMRYPLAAALLVLLTLTGVKAQEPTYDLRPIWEAGQTSRYQVISREVSSTSGAGGDARQTVVTAEAIVLWEVINPSPSGGGSCRMTIEELALRMVGPDGQEVVIGARGGGDDMYQPLRDLVRAMTGAPVTVEVSAEGRIERVGGVSAIRSRGGAAAEQMTDQDFIETASELAVLAIGPASAAPGAAWEENFEWGHEMGRLDLESRYELAGVEVLAGVPVAMINRRSEVDFTPEPPDLPEGAPEVDIRLDRGEQSAQIMFDLSRQEVVGQNVDRTLTFDVTIRFAGRTLDRTVTEQVSTQILRLEEGE